MGEIFKDLSRELLLVLLSFCIQFKKKTMYHDGGQKRYLRSDFCTGIKIGRKKIVSRTSNFVNLVAITKLYRSFTATA